MWHEITIPSPNFDIGAVEVWKWINNFIPHFITECDYLSMLGLKFIHVSKKGPSHCIFIWSYLYLKSLFTSLWPKEGTFGIWQWTLRHNGYDGVSNHQPHHCLLNLLFKHRSKKTSKLRVTGLCAGNSPVTGEFLTQIASNVENVSIWWCHHEINKITLLFSGKNEYHICTYHT